MGSPAKNPRIVVIDILRGFFMLAIVVNHLRIFPNIFVLITGGTLLWVSFAEGFFVISGFVFAYVNRNVSNPISSIIRQTLTRIIKLYWWSILLTVLFTLWGNLLPVESAQSGLWILNNDNWTDMIFHTLSLKYVYGWANYLPYYIMFLLFAPFIIAGFRKKLMWFMLSISFLIWLLRGNNVYMAQQIIFVIGMAIGYNYYLINAYYLKQNIDTKKIFERTVISVCLGSLIACIISIFFLRDILIYLVRLGVISASMQDFLLRKNAVLNLLFDKRLLGIGRLILDPIWLGTVYIIFCKYTFYLKRIFGGLLGLLGKNSLRVYIIHSIVIFPVSTIVSRLHIEGWVGNSIVVVLVLILVCISAQLNNSKISEVAIKI